MKEKEQRKKIMIEWEGAAADSSRDGHKYNTFRHIYSKYRMDFYYILGFIFVALPVVSIGYSNRELTGDIPEYNFWICTHCNESLYIYGEFTTVSYCFL